MRLILFRHGPAETRDATRWPDDSARPLTTRGVERTRRAAHGIACLEPGISRVLTSPAVRARDSARLLAGELGLAGEPATLAALAPDGAWRVTLERLAAEDSDATLALVGHEPELGALAGALLLSAEAGALAFKKAGACAIDCDVPELGRGRLRWWLRPSALRAMRPFKKGRVA